MKTVKFWSCLSIILFFWVRVVKPAEEMMCAGLSYSNVTKTGLGLISMGASEWFEDTLNTLWGAKHMRPSNLKKEADPLVNISQVHGLAADGTMRVLNGWLQVTVARPGKGKEFAAVAIWASAGPFETYGQFVLKTPAENCKRGEWKAPEFIPCSGTPVDAPSNPNMFVWTVGRGSTKPKVNKVNVLWKADHTYCNAPKEIRFSFAVAGVKWNSPVKPFNVYEGDVERTGPLLYQTSELKPRFYGAASPIFDKNALSCDLSVDSVQIQAEWMRSGASTNDPYGIREYMSAAAYKPRWTSCNSPEEDEEYVIKRQACRPRAGFVDFGGRCNGTVLEAMNSKSYRTPNFQTPPRCLHLVNAIEPNDFMTVFEQNGTIDTEMHLNEYIYRIRKPEVHKTPCDCPPIPTADEVKAAAKTRQALAWIDANPYKEPERGCKVYEGKPAYHKHGLCLRSVAGQHAFGVRQWHAATNLFCCMVLVPISCFLARYLKGAIPVAHDTLKPHIRLRRWYTAHVFLVLPIVCMYVSGISAIQRQLKILGFSRTPEAGFHRVSGFVIMGLFGFQCVFGFLRPVNVSWRKFAIFIHWFCGYAVYYFGAIVCILTYRIPASPFAYRKVLDPRFKKVQYHLAPMLMIFWLIVDLILHITVTMYVINYDKERLDVKRSYFPVFLPMRMDNYYLRTHDYDDLPNEDLCLHRMFYGYCIFCVSFFAFTLVATTYLNFENDHGFGPMQCTHNSKNLFTAGSTNLSEEDLMLKEKFCKL